MIHSVQTNSECVVSVGAGSSQLPLIKAINAAGYCSIAFDRDASAPGSSETAIFFECSTHDYECALAHLSSVEEKIITVMVQATGVPVVTASHIAQTLDLDFISPKIAEKIIWKDKLARFACENDIQIAGTIANCHYETVPADFFPAVLRPNRDIRGRSTCFLVKDKFDFEQRLLDHPQHNGYSLSKFIKGYDIALVCVFDQTVNNIRGVWLREHNRFGDEGAIDFEGISPLERVPANIAVQAKAMVRKVLHLSGANRGCLNFSFRVSTDEVLYLIEIHPELVGEYVLDEIVPSFLDKPFLADLVRFNTGALAKMDYLPEV